MSRSLKKDTSLDYGYGEEVVTKKVRDLASGLTNEDLSFSKKDRAIFEIAISFRGSTSRFSSPPLGRAEYQERAAFMIKEGSFSAKDLFSLKEDIFSLKEGHSVDPSERMISEQNDLRKGLKQSFDLSMKKAQELDLSLNRGRGLSL